MVATGLWDNRSLLKLELCDNGIGDQGVGAPRALPNPHSAALRAAVRPDRLTEPRTTHRTDTRRTSNEHETPSRFAEDLLEACSRNTTLTELGLQGNTFDLANLEEAVLGVRSSLILGL